MSNATRSTLVWPVRLCWAGVFALVGLCALAWWLLMPGGFHVDSPRFWSNAVLPWVWLLTSALGFYASVGSPALLQWLCVAPAAGLLATLVTVRALHPLTAATPFWWAMLGLAAMLGALVLATTRGNGARWWQLLTALAFTGIGACLPLSLRAPPASTRPLGRGVPSSTLVVSDDRVVVYEHRRLRVELSPSLTFWSRSPDGAWTLFAPRDDREAAPPPSCTLLRGPAELAEGIQVEAQCELGAPVFSHLNDYASLRVSGHKRLSIVFSPIPDLPLDVLPVDYPEGRPFRFGYLDASEIFHVVEASSAEKGPFRELGAGPLRRGDPLTLTLLDDDEPVLRVVFHDWSAQLSTAASPSAGWGVPENALTFWRLGIADNSSAALELTLAGTGIGRGFDSVTHAAGVYRNRVQIGPDQVPPRDRAR